MKNLVISLVQLFLVLSLAQADTINSLVKIQGGTDGTKIGNVSDALKVNVTNATSSTVNQGTGGVSPWSVYFLTPQAVTGTFFQSVQPVSQSGSWSVLQSGVWTTGRTWTLLNSTDSVTSYQGGSWNASVTGTVTSNIGTTGGLALDSTLASLSAKFNSLGQKTSAASAPVVLASDQSNLNTNVHDGAGTAITSTLNTGKQGLDVNVINATSNTVNQGTTPWVDNVSQFGGNNVVTGTGASGLGIPRITVSNDSNILATQSGAWTTGRTWSLLNTTDSVNAVQSGAWTTGRTWTLASGTDSVAAVQSGTWSAGRTWTLSHSTDSLASWLNDGAGNAITSQANGSQRALDVGIDVAGVQIDPRSIRALTASDVVTANQGGTWNINNISGTISLPTGASTSANQTSGSQKTQVVDGANATVGPVQTITGTNYFPVVQASSGTNGSAVPARTTLVGGSDGTNTRTFSTDTSGNLNVNVVNTPADADSGSTGAAVPAKAGYIAGINAGNLTGIAVDASGRTLSDTFDGSGNAITSSTFNTKTGLSQIASGQDILTVTGTGSALNGDAIAATDVAAYRDVSLQIVVTGTNTTTFQGSNDNFTNTFSVNCQTTANGTTSAVQTTAASGLFHCPIFFRYFRARVTAFTSGSSAGTAIIAPRPSDNDLGQRVITGTLTGITNAVNTNPATFNFGNQVASAAHTVSGNSGNITQAAPNNQALFNLQVTAVSGTTPTLDLIFQESYDGGTTWTDEWHWERVTATGQFSTPNLVMNTSHFRFVWTIGGTTPSFTFSITSNQGNQVGMIQRRFFDRTVVLNTTNSTTGSFLTDGCLDYNFTVNDSACTTFPSLALQTSEDNTNWSTSGLTLTTTANGTFMSATSSQQSHWSRVIVTTGGTTCALGYVALRCHQN